MYTFRPDNDRIISDLRNEHQVLYGNEFDEEYCTTCVTDDGYPELWPCPVGYLFYKYDQLQSELSKSEKIIEMLEGLQE